jgi:putative membrane-bound dehydrogenase-like protein
MRRPFLCYSLLLASSLLLGGALWLTRAAPPDKKAGPHSPLSPEQARAAFHLAPGLRIELVASEPQVQSPVAMAFDEHGKLWVVEMHDYPNGPAPGKPPGGRIKILEDRDGDGRYEHATVFADNLLFANGLMHWKGGVVVTAAPHILYLKDSDGDGKADKREVLYEGFVAQNPQLRVSHPTLGLDGWVYVANGLRGGQVKAAGRPDSKPINISGMDFRFNLMTGEHEAISGMGQYGNCFDDWGNRFVCDNRHHLRHVVIESRYLKRNPLLAAPQPVEDISELDNGPLNSGGKIYPLSKNWTTSNLHAGRFTAACGVFVYRKGGILPEKYQGVAFTCDPTGNLVHGETMTPHGATFRSHPLRKGVEFLATPDDWFRPVSLADGPDGALYVVDMYRAVIEHPDFMPTELKHRPDLLLGKNRGRIWRIVPEGYKTRAIRPTLGKESIEQLIARLGKGNPWERLTAFRLLLQNQKQVDPKALIRVLEEEKDPLRLVQTLSLLGAMKRLDEKELAKILRRRQDPRLLEEAVRLAEPLLARSAECRSGVVRATLSDDARLHFQVALSLGAWDNEQILDPLATIALTGAEDRWTRLAVASSVPNRAGVLLASLLRRRVDVTTKVTPGRLALLQELATLAGARRDPGEVSTVLEALGGLSGKDRARWQMAGLNGLAEGMGRRGTQLGAFLKTLPKEKQQAVERTIRLLESAVGVAKDAKSPAEERLSAIRLLAHVSWEKAGPALTGLLSGTSSQEIRLAAVRALAAQPRPEVSGLLLKSWSSYTPAVRREVTEAMMRQPQRILVLLKEVEAGRVRPGDIDAVRVKQLTNHRNKTVRDQARKLLRASLPAERREVLARYQAALKHRGDASRGREVFKKNCATCHKVAGVGIDVGPDISDTRTKTAEVLLGDILNPNQAIDNNYVNYLVTLKNGRSLTGIIAAETAASITLKRAENQQDVVLRTDIEEIASTGISLMPEGLEKTIPVEQMADLLSFLKNWRYLDGAVPPLEKKTP